MHLRIISDAEKIYYIRIANCIITITLLYTKERRSLEKDD